MHNESTIYREYKMEKENQKLLLPKADFYYKHKSVENKQYKNLRSK